MKTFMEMSSVKMISAPAPPPRRIPHGGVVSAGAHRAPRVRRGVRRRWIQRPTGNAPAGPWSHSTSRGVGHRRAIAAAASAAGFASRFRNASCSG